MATLIIPNPTPATSDVPLWPSCPTCGMLADICPGVHWQDFDWEEWELDDTLSADRYEPVE